MLIDFTVENHNSIVERTTFSMLAAEDADLQPRHYVERTTADGQTYRLSKVAGIVGINSAGKTSLIHALYSLRELITDGADYDLRDEIEEYHPFQLDERCLEIPTYFGITFIGEDNLKYHYQIQYNKEKIVFEQLDFFPEGEAEMLFGRNVKKATDYNSHKIKVGKKLDKKSLIVQEVYENRPVLSVLGKQMPHPQVIPVFSFFIEAALFNFSSLSSANTISEHLLRRMQNPKFEMFLGGLQSILDQSTPHIKQLFVKELTEENFSFPEGFPQIIREQIMSRSRMQLYARYKRLNKKGEEEDISRNFENESEGTRLVIGTLGLFVDEFYRQDRPCLLVMDGVGTGVYYKVVNFIIEHFLDEEKNTQGNQLIFTNLNASPLSADGLHPSQVYVAKKNKAGHTRFECANTFEGITSETDLEKAYHEGKFRTQSEKEEDEQEEEHEA
jgi:AAA15 family ATPase/GTPase